MQAQELLDSFDFDNDALADDEIETIPCVQGHPVIDDRQNDLATHGNAARQEFVREALLIGRLKQTWAESPVHLQGSVHHAPRERVDAGGWLLAALATLAVQIGP